MTPQNISLNQILRYFVCGVISITAAAASYSGIWNEEVIKIVVDNAGSTVAFLSFTAFLCGALLYSVYRSIIYVYLGRFALLIAKKSQKIADGIKWFLPWTCSKAEYEGDKFRWSMRQDKKPDLTEWASQVHLLHCSGLAVVAGWFVAWKFGSAVPLSNIALPVTVFIGLALIMDARRRTAELMITAEGNASANKSAQDNPCNPPENPRIS